MSSDWRWLPIQSERDTGEELLLLQGLVVDGVQQVAEAFARELAPGRSAKLALEAVGEQVEH